MRTIRSAAFTAVVAAGLVACLAAPSVRSSHQAIQYADDPKPPAVDQRKATVYLTDSGKKYHASGSSYLKKRSRSMSLEDAKAAGYTPCAECKP